MSTWCLQAAGMDIEGFYDIDYQQGLGMKAALSNFYNPELFSGHSLRNVGTEIWGHVSPDQPDCQSTHNRAVVTDPFK